MKFSFALLAGTQVAKGHASKFFQPFLLPKDLKGRPEELKNKLLVDFDPSRCFIRDLEASTVKMIFMLSTMMSFPFVGYVHLLFPNIDTLVYLSLAERVVHHIPGMA